MTKKEFLPISTALIAAYPNSKIMGDSASLEFWYRMLQDERADVVENAVMEHISTNTFPPSIAEIRKLCADRCTEPIPGFDEAWGNVQKAISSYGWNNPAGAYETFDEITLTVVKNLGWNNLCLGENQAANRANFREAYEARAREAAAKRQLPEIVQQRKAMLIEQYVPKTERIEAKKHLEIETKEPEERNGPPPNIQEMLNRMRGGKLSD